MSLGNGSPTFGEFFRATFDAASTDSLGDRFKQLSKNGDREGMIKMLINISCVRDFKITECCRGKDQIKADELYRKFRELITENDDEHERKSRACSILNEALFAASASSRLFLDALLDCAKYWYRSKSFAKCLKYCECMLALPASFYEKTAEDANYFLGCRKECVHLERECSKELGPATSERRKHQKHKADLSNRSSNYDNTYFKKEVPIVDGKRHDVLKSCSDAVVLRSDGEKGRQLVASRNIKAGSVLIVDPPFSFSTDEDALDRNCLHCHVTLKSDDSIRIPCRRCETVSYCSEKCRRESWQNYHRYECPIFDNFYKNGTIQPQRNSSHLLLAYRTTVVGALSLEDAKENNTSQEFDVPFLNESFLRYHSSNITKDDEHDENKQSPKLGVNEVYNSRDYCTVMELETHCADAEPSINLIRAIEAIFLAKCFTFILSKMDVVCSKETFVPFAVAMLHHLQMINCNAYEIVENVRDENSRVWEPRCVGGAIYPTVSLVNHGCHPNVVRHSYPNGTVVVRALRFIGKGEEVLDCYGPHFLSEGRLSRREYLWKKYRFLCACEACSGNWGLPSTEKINYKCRACSKTIESVAIEKSAHKTSTKQCPHCRQTIDWKKLEKQLRLSNEKRLSAISKMYEGNYEQALPLLYEHINFIEKFLAAPNIETIKTQQCIIQCYNYLGCTSR